MSPYAATNFFTRADLELPGSAGADQLLDEARGAGVSPLPVTRPHRLATASAFQLLAFAGTHAPQPPRLTADRAVASALVLKGDLFGVSIRNRQNSLP